MSDEKRKVYGPNEAARVAMSKLSPTAKDIVLIRTPDNLDYRQMALLAEQFRPMCEQTGCAIMFTTDGTDVEMFNEKEMNELGWFKLHEGRKMKGTH